MRPRRVLLGTVTLLFLIGAIYDGILFRLSLSSFFSNEFSNEPKVKPQGSVALERIDASFRANATFDVTSIDGSTGTNVRGRLNVTRASSLRQSAVPSVHSNNRIDTSAGTARISPATIVVQLSGEMGNNLSKIAHGHALSLWLKREFGLEATVILRHQTHPKWVRARQSVQKCFPVTRSYNFSAANTPEFDNSYRQQSAWLGSSLDGININESFNVSKALQLFTQLNHSGDEQQLDDGNGNISLPFLYADLLVSCDLFMDKFYDDYRELFRVDPACCNHRPEPDESVFHFRNYLREMPRKARRFGYEELSPNQTAHQLFRHLGRGDKVAITTRFDASVARPYVEALENRGMKVRVITNQTDTQDFCFLMNAQKEMVGLARSTFFLWAGFLGNCSRVRAYSVDSPDRRQAVPNVFDRYNWTHPELQSRVFFELFKADPL